MTLTFKGLFVTLGINDTQHNGTLYVECYYIECHEAECRDLFIIMLSVVMLNVAAPLQLLPYILCTYCSPDLRTLTK
jgi:hypothetical protein